MKRVDLIRHLKKHGCRPVGEGGRHSVWANPATGRQGVVPRHREVQDFTARAIFPQLDIEGP